MQRAQGVGQISDINARCRRHDVLGDHPVYPNAACAQHRTVSSIVDPSVDPQDVLVSSSDVAIRTSDGHLYTCVHAYGILRTTKEIRLTKVVSVTSGISIPGGFKQIAKA